MQAESKPTFERLVVRPVGVLGVLSLLLLALVIFAAVVARQAGISIIGADETGQLLLVFMVFLSMTVTHAQKGNVRMEALVSLLPPGARRVADLVSLLACLVLVLLLLHGTSLQAWSAYVDGEYQYGTMKFPLWPAKVVIAFGFLLFTIQLLLDLKASLAGLRGARPVPGESAAETRSEAAP